MRRAPMARAWVMASEIARSFCDPVGLAPSFFHQTRAPRSRAAGSSGVPPSPSVTGATPSGSGSSAA